MRIPLIVGVVLLAFAQAVGATPSRRDAQVYFITPQDGATVQSPVTIRFGLKKMGVAPSGIGVRNTGHHHLIIDNELPAMNRPIPSGPYFRHFDKGQTEIDLLLPPGRHTLQLLFGDFAHVPHNPPLMSKKITVNVE